MTYPSPTVVDPVWWARSGGLSEGLRPSISLSDGPEKRPCCGRLAACGRWTATDADAGEDFRTRFRLEIRITQSAAPQIICVCPSAKRGPVSGRQSVGRDLEGAYLPTHIGRRDGRIGQRPQRQRRPDRADQIESSRTDATGHDRTGLLTAGAQIPPDLDDIFTGRLAPLEKAQTPPRSESVSVQSQRLSGRPRRRLTPGAYSRPDPVDRRSVLQPHLDTEPGNDDCGLACGHQPHEHDGKAVSLDRLGPSRHFFLKPTTRRCSSSWVPPTITQPARRADIAMVFETATTVLPSNSVHGN